MPIAVVVVLAIVLLAREALVGGATLALAFAGARRIDVLWVGQGRARSAVMFALPMLLLAPEVTGGRGTRAARSAGGDSAIPGTALGYYAAAKYVPAARAALAEGRQARLTKVVT